MIGFVSKERRFLTFKNHDYFVLLPNWMIQMARGVQLDGTQFCLGYQDQKKNTQGARRFQSLNCLVINISTLAPNLLLNWVSCLVETQCIFFSYFWNFIPYVTKYGVMVLSLLDFTNNFIVFNVLWISFEFGRANIELNDVVQERATCNKISMFNYICVKKLLTKK